MIAETWPAQLLGGAGYLVLILSTQLGSRRNFLIADICGLIPVILHYLLLGAPAGAALSALYVAIDVTAALLRRSRWARGLFPGFYLLAVAATAAVYAAPRDLLALSGTLAAVLSRRQAEMHRLLGLVLASCVGWGLYGFLAGSIGQAVFSSVYGLFSLVGILRIRHQTHT